MDRCKTAAEAEETLNIIAPFLPRAIVNELCSGRKYADYRERKKEIQLGHINFGMWYQRNVIAPQLARSRPRFEVEGIRWLGTISEELEYSCRSKYGRNCWGDPDFVKHTLKHTPEARAPQPKAPFLVVQGFRDSRRPAGSDSPADSDRGTGAANGARGEPATPEKTTGRPWNKSAHPSYLTTNRQGDPCRKAA